MTEPKKKPSVPTATAPIHPHPLFEPEEPGEEAPIVLKIHVTRWDRDGKQRFFPSTFPAEQLTDLQQIADAFGGGTYELRAYGPGGCTARRRYSLDGRSKPLTLATDADEEGTGPVAGAAPLPIAPTGSPDTSLFLAMIQSQGESTRAMLGMMTQLTTAMLTRDRESADRTLAMMQQNNTAQMQATANLIGSIMSGKNGGGGNVLEMIREGMAIGQQMATPPEEGNSVDSLIEMAAPFVVGAAQAQAEQARAAASAPPPAPTGAEP